MLCCKIRENRRALLRLGALNVLLETARHGFSVDAMEPAEGILLIVESLTLEANESDNISITESVLTVTSGEIGASEQAKKIVLMFLESNGYGEPPAMDALVQHFEPYKTGVNLIGCKKTTLRESKR
ncbi:hypothetical protein RHGRI_014364 [Rhododendron griersonianum]|uniref:E3 ubiquitin ligase UBR4 C-terminal domain-containing protein n=1 Tax=Rhododendron griersonianum TaxID=479676 RepID=A0AAV6K9B9_9ERIC|nr:hypothetical protein RHGRI_014364 [Rhododendron griersonianum]